MSKKTQAQTIEEQAARIRELEARIAALEARVAGLEWRGGMVIGTPPQPPAFVPAAPAPIPFRVGEPVWIGPMPGALPTITC